MVWTLYYALNIYKDIPESKVKREFIRKNIDQNLLSINPEARQKSIEIECNEWKRF